MPDPVPALGGARSEGAVTVTEMPVRGMIVLRGDLSDAGVKSAVAEAAGLKLPDPLTVRAKGDRALCWMAPDEVLVQCAYGEVADLVQRIAAGLADRPHLVADVSDARAVFRLTGPACREVLARLTPADLSPAAFAPGAFRRTRLAQIAAALCLRDDAMAEVLCFRSVARYAFDLLSNAAAPGREVGFFR